MNGDGKDSQPNQSTSYAFAAPLRQFERSNTTTAKNTPLPIVKKSFKKSIIHAEINSSKRITEIESIPLTLDENTANVVDICKLLFAHFKRNMVLVDCKCLKIVDSVHTRGASFWKSTRKIFCANEESFKRVEIDRKRAVDDIESDEDEFGNFLID